LKIPTNYQVLFLAGGASAQFAMVPLNLFPVRAKADYIDTGIWSKKAIAEAKRYGEVNIATQLDESGPLARIPAQATWSLSKDSVYVHYTPNETIGGVEFHWIPQTGEIPLVADMSSTLLSHPLDVSAYGIIYASAQKNISQAGITVVIIRDDLIREALPNTPTLYQYAVQAENKSFYNTPPTYSWYLAGLTLAWMKRQGGLSVFAERSQRKAQKLYAMIDESHGFYVNKIDPECRSLMNVPFYLPSDRLTGLFLEEAKKAGLTHLKGHKLAGGIRASIYNPMPEAGVDALVDFMRNFMKNYG
jgi:phosphoserine aminotransferase